MRKNNALLFMLIILPMYVSGKTVFAIGKVEADTSIVSKREYKTLQTKGDELFKEGNYMSARKKYLAMKAVPGFENDPTATQKDELAISCYELANQASALLSKGKSKEANALLEKLLGINPGDVKAKTRFGELWYAEGVKKFKEGNYAEAKENFIQSMEYSPASESNMINLYVNSCNTAIEKAKKQTELTAQKKAVEEKPPVVVREDKPKPVVSPEPIVKRPAPAKVSSGGSLMLPKIGLGVIAIGAGLYANSLRSKFNSQVKEVNSMASNISSFQTYKDYEAVYKNAEDYKADKQGTTKAMFGVAAGAVIADGVLFMLGGKRNNRMVSVSPGEVSTVKLNFILK